MSFTVADFNDFKQLLLDHPQWQIEVRRLLLSEDFEALPGIVGELATAQRASSDRLAQIEAVVADLAEAQRRTEQQVRELAEAQRLTSLHIRQLVDRVGMHDGTILELEYSRKVPGYFTRWLRRAKAVDASEVSEQLEARLTEEELDDALLADLIVRGRVSQLPDHPEAYLIVEVSSVIDEHDVERAIRRAELFRRAGFRALPAVAGRSATSVAANLAEYRGVAMLDDGKKRFWEETLAKWPIV
jgi:hypothetical protein